MIRRGNRPSHHGAPPTDLLVCFPTRAHLALRPKQICSPARLSDRHFKKLPSLGTGTWSPVGWGKEKSGSSDTSEPSSPKVTCAGQIKVRRSSGAASCKSWQSVMEEIERIHKKQKKRASWGDALGFKKEVMQFLTCLRNIKLDFRCFGAMPECDISSDEDEEEEEEEEEEHQDIHDRDKDKEPDPSSGTKWFMVLQENQDTTEPATTQNEEEPHSPAAAPPPNALLLMRCRSAPAKSWLENRARVIVEQEERDKETQQEEKYEEQRIEKPDTEEIQRKKKLRDYLVVMEYDTDFYKLSTDIAKETWVVGSINPSNPQFSRSRSWRR